MLLSFREKINDKTLTINKITKEIERQLLIKQQL